MIIRKITTFLLLLCAITITAQRDRFLTPTDNGNNLTNRPSSVSRNDSTKNKEIPKGITTWTIDDISGERTIVEPDTSSYMFMNTILPIGKYGEYNNLGNNGSPRMSRIFIDRPEMEDFIFMVPYSQVNINPSEFHFTNTYSPITNLAYNECGNQQDGEDNLNVKFAVNVNKDLGFGFRFDYLYDRGYYQNQSNAHFKYTMWGSYLGERYQAHLLFSTGHHKSAENGGITNIEYITHPEKFSDDYTTSDIPTVLTRNWNRNDNISVFFNHRYSFGFSRKVPMTEKEIEAKIFAMAAAKEKEKAEGENGDNENKPKNSTRKTDEKVASGRPEGAVIAGDESMVLSDSTPTDTTRIALTDEAMRDSIAAEMAEKKKQQEEDMFMKKEYVPVTSIFHTLHLKNFDRTYLAYSSPEEYYLHDYYALENDSIEDNTKHTHLVNTFGVSLLEGFNKYMKAGIKAYASHELKHFTLPSLDRSTNSWTEQNLIIGGQISKAEGKTVHFDATGEFCTLGDDIGQLSLSGNADLNFPLLGDTVSLKASAFYHLQSPSFYYGRYQSRHYWWDNDLSKESHTHIEGILNIERTKTSIRVAADNIANFTYLGTTYDISSDYLRKGTTVNVFQNTDNIQVLTAQLDQRIKLGALHWDNRITVQKSSDNSVLPLPLLNIYTNLFLRFKIAHVLSCDLGADMRYFTEYDAPEYNPALTSFVIQKNDDVRMKIGNYPIVNVYANMQLKTCRFFVMMSHVNCNGKGNYFLTPYHPINQSVLHLGLSWNFYN